MTEVLVVEETPEEKELLQALQRLQGHLFHAAKSGARDPDHPAYVNLLPELAKAIGTAEDTKPPTSPEALREVILSEVEARDAAAVWAKKAVNDYPDHSGPVPFRSVIRRMRNMRGEGSSEPESR